MKLYELTENKITIDNKTLTQIRAACDFECINKGDLGGWIECESSLSDNVWIHQKAKVFRKAKIYGGVIYGGEIHGGIIRGGVIRGGIICGGEIHGGIVRGGVIRGGIIWGGEIHGGIVRGGVIRGGIIWGGEICGGEIYGGEIHGGIIYDGEINKHNYIGFANVGSENGYLLAYVDNKKIMMSRGCFHGTIEEFYHAVEKKHGDNEHGLLYKSLRPIIENKLNKFC